MAKGKVVADSLIIMLAIGMSIFKTVSCDYASLRAFVVQFNNRIIDLLNKPKYLSIAMDYHVISLGKL